MTPSGKKPHRVHIETFGCQMNEYDSELVKSLLRNSGFEFTEDRERADVMLMNTCAIRENAHNKVYGHLAELKAVKEDNETLLDRTMVLYGTCMGSANSHSNVNLPALLVGGGFKHGQHLAFDKVNNYPLTNLYVSMLQRLGIEAHEFSTGKSTMRGLEMA